MVVTADSHSELEEKIAANIEWLLIRSNGRAFPLSANEIEIDLLEDRTQFGFVDDTGLHKWRLNGFAIEADGIALDVAGSFGKNRETIRLVPRIAAAQLAAEAEAARLEKANGIAKLIAEFLEAGIVRVSLAKDNSRFAHIIFRQGKGRIQAAIADVSGNVTHETLLAAAILWQERLESRKKDPIGRVSIAAEKRQAGNLQKLHAMLGPQKRTRIGILEISLDPNKRRLRELPEKSIRQLWREKPKKLVFPDSPFPSKIARKIIELCPEKIDVLYSKQGETLRFFGLPFARVRTMPGGEKAWFGVGREKRLLTPDVWNDLVDLTETLDENRNCDSRNKRHEFFRTSPEAWLESILRRNINLLDPNLILSPLYNQFRTANDKIDLLAMRKDGRLVVIELKTQPDREMIFQAADYWRKIELQRRSGQLETARAFGDRQILDKPALIYLVAPALSFHRDFAHFARMLSADIELWRFELKEDWRREVTVVARNEYRDQLDGRTNL